MPNIVIQIEKDKHILHTFTLQDATITKDTIEIAVFESTGLNYDQYEVYYVDCEDDLIMTAVEDDYSIAQSTLQTQTIVFHIDVKVPAEQIKIVQNRQQKPNDEEKRQRDSEQSQQDISQEQKVEQVYQSAISQKNQPYQKNKEQEQLERQKENLSNQTVNKQEQQQTQIKETIKNVVTSSQEEQAKNKQQTKNQIQNSNSEDIECDFQGLNENEQEEKQDAQRLAPQNQAPREEQLREEQLKQQQKMINCLKYLQQVQSEQIIFNKFLQKMSTILKPQCFRANQSITVNSIPHNKEEQVCLVCKQKITKAPYYINYRNQLICQLCEKNYEGTQNVVKVRNQKCRTDLLTSKFITISYEELSKQDLLYFLKQTDPKNRQKKIDQLLILKLQSQAKK